MDLGKIWRSIIEFDMLQAGDRVLIGFSGGKDSMLLTALLKEVQRHAPFAFDLAAFTVDTGFTKDFGEEKYATFCHNWQIDWQMEKINVPELMKNHSPCYSCAYFRRALLSRKAKELGYNKIALAHHGDDAVATYLLNLFTSGQQKTFCPVTKMSRSGITVIRPLIYYREKEILDEVRSLNFTPIKNPCPFDGKTQRSQIQKEIEELSQNYEYFYEHIFAALRLQKGMELWPRKLTKEEMVDKFHDFWKNK